MGIWDNIKKFAQPYSEEEYDEYEEGLEGFEEEPQEEGAASARRSSPFSSGSDSGFSGGVSHNAGFSGQVLNMNSGKQEVVLFHARSFDDAAKAADELRKKKAVILNMENVDKGLTRRVVDFLSGSIYALDGSVKKIAQSTYLFCPHNMDIVGDLEAQVEMEALV